jgi:hypothetical protein
MQPNNTSVLLAILLVVLNGKGIVNYILWLRFKITMHFKQLENERNDNNHTTRGPSAV